MIQRAGWGLPKWLFLTGSALFVYYASVIQADPTDDFSFTLAAETGAASYRLMPKDRVVGFLTDNLVGVPNDRIPVLASHLMELCERYRFDPAFILALIQVESSYNARSVSPRGAIGLMQVQVPTGRQIANQLGMPFHGVRTLRDPFANLTLGIAYLAQLRDRYSGFPPHFLAAYNAGPGKMDELLFKKRDFKPVKTKSYFESIRRWASELRFYQSAEAAVAAPRQR